MEDRHANELSSAIRSVGSAISGLAFSILMGLIYVGCMIASHH